MTRVDLDDLIDVQGIKDVWQRVIRPPLGPGSAATS